MHLLFTSYAKHRAPSIRLIQTSLLLLLSLSAAIVLRAEVSAEEAENKTINLCIDASYCPSLAEIPYNPENTDLPIIGYFVDAVNGSDNNDGRSDATAWRTLAKVGSSISSEGSDVWFKAGHEWKIGKSGFGIDVDWSCTSLDRCIVGTYWMNGGVETRGLPSGGEPGDPFTSQSSWEGATFYSDYPGGYTTSNKYRPIIRASSKYVNFENINCWKSNGRCYEVDSSSGYVVVDNVMSHISANVAYISDKDVNGGHTVIKNSTFSEVGRCYTDGMCSGYTAGVTVARSSHNVFENNLVMKTAGEGLSTWLEGGHNIFRNNVVIWPRSVGIYINGSHDNIVEQNLVLGGAGVTGTDAENWYRISSNGTSNTGAAFSLNYEDSGILAGIKAVGNIFRNNIAIGTGTCFAFSAQTDTISNPNSFVGAKFVGNTCVYNTRRYVDTTKSHSQHVGAFAPNGIVIMNNVFGKRHPDYSNNGDNCRVVDYPSIVSMDYNLVGESGGFDDADCRGENDKVGEPNFPTSTFPEPSPDNVYDDSDVCLGGASLGIGTGGSLPIGELVNYYDNSSRLGLNNMGAVVSCN